MPTIRQSFPKTKMLDRLGQFTGDTPTSFVVPATVTVKQAATLLHSSKRYVERLMYSGTLAYYKPTRNKVLIDAQSLRTLFAKPANAAVMAGDGGDVRWMK